MRKFYDIHMHAFDLSHPNLSVFLQRSDLILGLFKTKPKRKGKRAKKDSSYKKIIKAVLFALIAFVLFALTVAVSPLILLVISIILTKNIVQFFPFDGNFMDSLKNAGISLVQWFLNLSFVKKGIEKAMRTLTFFEIPMEYQFLILEYFLNPEKKEKINIGGVDYDKIVLCPLIIDFGKKGISEGVFYNLTPKRPTVTQTGDLLYAIRTYYRFNVKVENEKMDLENIENWESEKGKKLFEIYPFMGIDTQNYDSWEEIKKTLDRYFKNFEKNDPDRQKRIFEKLGKQDDNMYGDTDDFKNKNGYKIDYSDLFAGIKLYPQLGFDPYPKDPEERKKVKELYRYCIEKRIPITTHCSDGGYKTGDNNILTSPSGKWKTVLEKFPELTLNFAHFGSQGNKKTKWREAIIQFINSKEKYPNVYTDISCNDMSPEYYNELEKSLNANPQLQEKVLFGSDFSINMLATQTESYNQFLEPFANAKLSNQIDLCEGNPERFLFGLEPRFS